MNIIIYSYKNIITNEEYIGSTKNLDQRKRQHKYSLLKNKHYSQKLQESFNIYGINAFEYEVLEITIEEFRISVETKYLNNRLPAFNKNTIHATNLGRKLTEEQRKKLSNSHMGLPNPCLGRKTNKPAWNRGIPQTEEAKRKLSLAHKGHRRSPATEIKPGQILDENIKTKVLCVELNKVFDSMSEAALFVGNINRCANISAVCRGRQKTAYGYTWKYASIPRKFQTKGP